MARELWQSRLLRFLRTVLSLLCGIVTGVALAIAIEIEPDLVALYQHKKLAFPLSFTAGMSLGVAPVYATEIALLSILPWWLLGRIGRRNFVTAASLGFLMTYIVRTLPNLLQGIIDFQDENAVFLGLAGAVAGLVTFWVARRVSAV